VLRATERASGSATGERGPCTPTSPTNIIMRLPLLVLLLALSIPLWAQASDPSSADRNPERATCTEATTHAFDELTSIKAKFQDTARRVAAANAKLPDASEAYDRPPIALELVDVAPFTFPSRHTDAEREASVELLLRAFRTMGFAVVTGHAVPDALVEEVSSQLTRFMLQPDAYKRAVGTPANRAVQLGWSRYNVSYAESYGVVPEGEAERERFGANQFPADMPEFRAASLWLYAEMERVYDAVLSMISRGLRLAPDHLRRAQGLHRGLLSLNYQPNVGKRSRPTITPHTDWGMLTVLRVSRPGLEIITADDEWRSVQPLNGTFIINVGDALERITNGRLVSTVHCVRRWFDSARVSIPFFGGQALAAGDDTMIQPVDALVGGDDAAARYPPFNFREFINHHWHAYRVHGLPKMSEGKSGEVVRELA